MVKRSKVISKIMVLALCANIVPCANVFAVEKSTGNETSTITEENNTEKITEDYETADTTSAAVKADVADENDFNFDKSTGTILKYTGSSDKVVVPAEIQGVKVTNIGEYAFSDCQNIKYIYIPEGVTEIGSYAFEYCYSLEEIILPGSLKEIKEFTFYYCIGLKVINIPEGVTKIHDFAFAKCENLETITLPDSITELEPWAFSGINFIVEKVTKSEAVEKLVLATSRR